VRSPRMQGWTAAQERRRADNAAFPAYAGMNRRPPASWMTSP